MWCVTCEQLQNDGRFCYKCGGRLAEEEKEKQPCSTSIKTTSVSHDDDTSTTTTTMSTSVTHDDDDEDMIMIKSLKFDDCVLDEEECNSDDSAISGNATVAKLWLILKRLITLFKKPSPNHCLFLNVWFLNNVQFLCD